MIEVISTDACIACNICVKICPTNVFDAAERGVPRIARQSDCQTCFMCEAYCPVDALYVSPLAEQVEGVSITQAKQQNLLGSYRRSLGWDVKAKPATAIDLSFRLLPPV